MKIIIERPAMPKARPNFGKGRAYMPKEYMDWKDAVAQEALLRGAVLLDRPVVASFVFSNTRTVVEYEPIESVESGSRGGMLTGDVDNYIGGMMDALEGVAWKNDRLIWNASGQMV